MVMEVNLRFDLRFSFGNTDFLCLYGWPSSGYGSTLSLLTQGSKEATIGITSMFSCSTERSKRGECCM